MYWTYDFSNNHATGPYGAVILAYGYIPAQDTFLIVSQLEYGKPVVNPPILQNFTKILSIGGTMRISNLTGLMEELLWSTWAQVSERCQVCPSWKLINCKQTYWTATFKNTAALTSHIQAIFVEEINKIKGISDFLPVCVFQPISKCIPSNFANNGGNALGMTPADGPLSRKFLNSKF